MNKNNAAQYLPFVKALADGKDVEFYHPETGWRVVKECTFPGSPERYRIKREPLIQWAVVEGKDRVLAFRETEDQAIHYAQFIARQSPSARVVKMVEEI